MTYAEAYKQASHIGAALASLNASQGASVGIYATNSPEWMLAMKAADFCGARTVPLYDTFGPDAVKFIVKHSDAKVVFVGSDKFETFCEALPELKGQLTQVVVWGTAHGLSAEDVVKSVRACASCRRHAIIEWPPCMRPLHAGGGSPILHVQQQCIEKALLSHRPCRPVPAPALVTNQAVVACGCRIKRRRQACRWLPGTA